MKAIRFISAAAAAACLTFTACSDYVGKEDSHPLYAKYESARNKKAYEEAAENLEEFLTICPKSPKAHYDVAMVYKENLRKYPFAIYHLQKYLDLSGETISKEDAAAIQGYMQDCKRLMAADAAGAAAPQSNSALIAAQKENEALKEKIGTLESRLSGVELLERRLSAQKAENKALGDLVKELQSKTQTQTRQPAASTTTPSAPRSTAASSSSTIPSAPRSTAASSSSTIPSAPRSTAASIPTSTTGTPGTTITAENGVRYYYVGNGEGLQAVSKKMYGTTAMTKLIQDANGGVTNLKLGQRLIIPPMPQQ